MRPSLLTRVLLWTFVLAVFTARAGDAHLHLCMDGQEPPASVHFADASLHNDGDHENESHADTDVNPLLASVASNLSKKGDNDADAALLITFVVLSWELQVAREAPHPRLDAPVPTASSFHLRPPLRGPPA